MCGSPVAGRLVWGREGPRWAGWPTGWRGNRSSVAVRRGNIRPSRQSGFARSTGCRQETGEVDHQTVGSGVEPQAAHNPRVRWPSVTFPVPCSLWGRLPMPPQCGRFPTRCGVVCTVVPSAHTGRPEAGQQQQTRPEQTKRCPRRTGSQRDKTNRIESAGPGRHSEATCCCRSARITFGGD